MYTLLVTGDVPGASTYFNPLVQQSIIPVTSGTRPTPSHEGMTIHESDTDSYAKWTGSAWEYQGKSRTAYTPTLSATTTPPTMGTGAIRNGWYSYLPGGQVVFTFFIRFGTSMAAGSGSYTVSLPVTAAQPFGSNGSAAYGACLLADASAGTFRLATSFIDITDATTLRFVAEGSAPVNSGAPWAWAASDYLSGNIIYAT